MKRNVDLLQKVMQHIIDHPEQHEQMVFISDCGTAACFAGWAGLFSGMTAKQVDSAYMWHQGANLLGLTKDEAHALFDSDNSRPMLELMVKDLVNGDELHSPGYYYMTVSGFRAPSESKRNEPC